MYNGNPKLVCHDKTCHYCKTLCKDIVETWELYNFSPDFHVCIDCSNQIAQKNEKIKEASYKKRLENLAANMDFLANDTGWIKDREGRWYNKTIDQWSIVHPIKIEKPEDLLEYVPQGWVIRYDHEDMMAFDSRVNLEMPLEIRFIDNSRYFYMLLLDHDGFSAEQSLAYDILSIIIKIRKLELQ